MLELRYNDVNWSVPMLFGEDVLILTLLNILKQQNIKYKLDVYGAPICEWSNNIGNYLETDDVSFISRSIDNFSFQDVTPTLSFDRFNLQIISFFNRFCNDIANEVSRFGGNFVLTSDKLFKHIKKQYPKAYCISSCFKPFYEFADDIKNNTHSFEKELEYYNQLIKVYDRVILRPEFVNSGLVKHLDDLSKVEIIVNHPCIKDCPSAKKHLEYFEKKLNLKNEKEEFMCRLNYKHYDELNPDLLLSFDEIDSFVEDGVKHFRILPVKSSNSSILLMTVINYIFKPNTQNSLLCDLVLKNFDETSIFYADEILKNSKIQNYKNAF